MENIKSKIQLLVNLYKSKNLIKAENYAKELLRENPKIVFLYNILGLILVDQNKTDDAVDCFERGLQVNPDNIDVGLIYNNLGTVHFYRSNYFEAENLYKKAIKTNNKNYEALNNLGNLFIKQNLYEKGIASYKKSIEINEKFIPAIYNLSIAYKNTGNFAESKKYLFKAIEIKNDFFTAHRNLSEIIKYEKGDKHLDLMINLYKDNTIKEEKKIELAFALGKAYNDINDFDKAFSFLKIANELRKKQVPFFKKKESENFTLIKKVFNEKVLEKINIKNKDSSIIFIVGMPRSGTTLVEQIISSHTKVFGGDEISLLPELIEKNFKDVSNIVSSDQETLIDISQEYITFLKKISNNSEKITDKLPINFKWIGLIKSIFPNSKIVHCIRNPKDVCFSIYKNYFTNKKLNFAYDISDIIFFYNLYADLMMYWKKMFPNFIIDVVYENLITDTDNEIKKVIKSLDLNWDSKCIKFYENSRPIRTASDTQARKKIYKSSINMWKNYEKNFDKFFKDLKA